MEQETKSDQPINSIQTPQLGIDHVVILVNDLSTAIEDYSSLGFTVTLGGQHQGGATHNALITFSDGSYLELIASRPNVAAPQAQALSADPGHLPSPTLEHRFARLRGIGEGLIDFALRSESLPNQIELAARRGLRLSPPLSGGRIRPDGQKLSWLISLPESSDLPFLIQDLNTRSLRVPGGEAATHANGAQGIAEITVGVSDLPAARIRYEALSGNPSYISVRRAPYCFGFHGGVVSLVSGDVDPEVDDYIAAGTDRPYSISLSSRHNGIPSRIDARRSHQARIMLPSRTEPPAGLDNPV
jgi:catechol 2,3-dioxygenase-like lactoylglutathione lyase family enzyme